MYLKKATALLAAIAMVVPACLGNVGTLQVQAEGMVTEADLADNSAAAPDKDDVVPNAYQYEYQKDELAAFCHFGMNTFTGSEWGNGQEDPSRFNLTTKLDADTYVKTLKEAGFKKLIVTAKHHDGFCIWDSEFTEHDTAATNYPGGDVLADISAACTNYDMDMGLYLSPWDVNNRSYGYYDSNGNILTSGTGADATPLGGRSWEQVEADDAENYIEYYNNQLEEILSNPKYGNNGEFKEVWMDGANGGNGVVQFYQFNKWYETIQKYQGLAAGKEADCMVFGMDGYTTVRWIGNEQGHAAEETWSKSKATPYKDHVINSNNGGTINSNSTGSHTQGFSDGNQWTVPEVDARITQGWFWNSSASGKTPKSMEDLGEMYFRSVGHNAPLLLNIPPNNQGTVDEAILQRVEEFGNTIRDTFTTNYAASKDASISASEVRGNDIAYSPNNLVDGDDASYWTVEDGQQTGTVEINLGMTRNIDVVSVEESIEFGQRITGFKIEYSNEGGEWKTFDEGTTIGAKRLSRRAPVKADKVRITIQGTTGGVPMLNEVGVYKAAKEFETAAALPEVLEVVDHLDKDISDGNGFTYSGWTQEKNDSMITGSGMWANTGAEFTFTFTGTKAWLIGTIDPNHGMADIYLDGAATPTTTIDTNSSVRKLNQMIYTTPDLAPGTHTVRLVTKTKAIGIHAGAVLNNNGQGMFEIAESDYQVTEGVDDYVEMKVVRIGGTAGEVKVAIGVNPGSAIQSDFDADFSETLTFAEGETEKTVRVAIKRNSDDERRLETFTAEIMPLAEEAVQAAIGFNRISTVTIYEPQEDAAQQLLDLIVDAKRLNGGAYTTATYTPMKKALQKAMAIASDMEATEEQWNAVKNELQTAKDALVKREGFSEEDRFRFPDVDGESSRAEAEFFELDAEGAAAGHEVRVKKDDSFSNGGAVDWFDPGNKIAMPFTAKKAGTYTVSVGYISGSIAPNLNKFNWSGDHVKEGSVEVPTTDSKYGTFEFDIEITEPGDGILNFTADESKSPTTDYFEFKAKKLQAGTYTITASAGEHGSISDEGDTELSSNETKTYTITPDKGYEIEDVLVNGVSVGAVTSYTFDGLNDDATIEATFKFSYYTSETPAVLKAAGENLVEAEYFELIPIATDKYVRITSNDQASNKKEVNWFEQGNKIKLAFNAEQAGTYHVTATYRSGRIQGSTNPNAFEWSGTNVNTGSLDVYGEDGAGSFHTAEFDIEIADAGAGELVFTASAKAGPVIDKFVIERKGDGPEIVAVTGVSLNKKTAVLDVNDTVQLKETVAPANATNKEVTWKSSDTKVATVSSSGLVTAKASGEATITVTTEDGNKTDTCKVTVNAKPVIVPVTGVSLDKTTAAFDEIGKTLQLKETVAPANATNKKVTWDSADEKVAAVDEKGLVTVKGEGQTVITVTTEDGKKTAKCTITVKLPEQVVSVTGVTLDKTALSFDQAGQTAQLTAAVAPANATNKGVTFASSNTAVATVDAAGKVTAVGNGTADITVTTADGGFKAASKVTVSIKPVVVPTKPAKVTGVKVKAKDTKSLIVTWDKQDNADSYKVYLYQNKKWAAKGTLSDNKLTIKKLKAGNKYSVKVEAVNKQGTGEASKVIKTATKPDKTKIVKIQKTGAKKVKLTFKKVKGSGYEVSMKVGKKYQKPKSVTKNSFTKTGLKPGKKYTFRVRPYVKNGSAKVYGSYTQKTFKFKK